MLKHIHVLMGHLGLGKTLQYARDCCFWPGMYSEVKEYIGRRKGCTLGKAPETKRLAGLESILTTRPLELVYVDFLSPERSKGGFVHVLVITDHFTCCAQAFPTRDEKAATVARVLWEKFMVHYGIPERLHSDHGKCFESAIIGELCSLLGEEKTKTTPYHPQGSGMVERFNRTFLAMMGMLNPDQRTNWVAHLRTLTHAYNSSKHESTGHSPFHLIFLRRPKIQVDLLGLALATKDPGTLSSSPGYYSYLKQLHQHLHKVYQEVQANAEISRVKQRVDYDKKVDPSILQPGD